MEGRYFQGNKKQYTKFVQLNFFYKIKDWSENMVGGGVEQRGGGSSVCEPLVRDGS